MLLALFPGCKGFHLNCLAINFAFWFLVMRGVNKYKSFQTALVQKSEAGK